MRLSALNCGGRASRQTRRCPAAEFTGETWLFRNYSTVRALPLLATFLASSLTAMVAESASELANELLRKLGAAEAEAAKQQKPPAPTAPLSRSAGHQKLAVDGRAYMLRTVAELIRSGVTSDSVDNGTLSQLQGLLVDYPDLAKVAERWNMAAVAEYIATEKDADQEIRDAIRAAAADLREGQKPADLDGALANLRSMARKYPDESRGSRSPARLVQVRELAVLLRFTKAFQDVLAERSEARLREAGERLRALYQSSEVPGLSGTEVRALLDETGRKLGMPSLDDAEREVGAIIATAMAASSPVELDPLLDQLIRVSRMWADFSLYESTKSKARLGSVGLEFVARWQDFLAAKADGRTRDAQSIIERLLQFAEKEPTYPRGKLIEAKSALGAEPGAALVAEVTPAGEKLLAGIKTLNDLLTQMPVINARLASFPGTYFTVPQDLERIARGYAALRTGNLAAADMAVGGGFDRHPKVAELRAQLCLQMAAVAFHEKGSLALQPDEKLPDYLRRLSADALERKAWPRLKEIFDTTADYSAFRGTLRREDGDALHAFLGARNLDRAGVWTASVASYIAALEAGSAFVPVDEIKKRLDAIRREHPGEYARGSRPPGTSETPPPK